MRSVGLTVSILLLALVFNTSALEATQTDWSGGGGVPGPVTDWGNRFDTATDTSYAGSPGNLTLGRSPVEHSVDGAFRDALSVCAADLDGDHDVDLIGSSEADGEVAWWANDGSGGGWTKNTISDAFKGARAVCAADIDGDTDIDVVGSSSADWTGTVYWWENDGSGGGWTSHAIMTGYSNAREVSTADVDGDDDLDVMCVSSQFDDMYWFSNDDGVGGSWTAHQLDGTPTGGYFSARGADMDGDSDTDIVAAAWNANTVLWWENTDGSGLSWTEHVVSDAVSSVRSVFPVDLDGDNDLDVVAAAFMSDTIYCLMNADGSGTSWTESVVNDDFVRPMTVYATDMDSDDDADILGAAWYDDRIAWWENDGSGGGWSEHPVAEDFNEPWDVYPADLDGDNAMDVASAAVGDDEIAWWSFTAYTESGRLTSSILDVTGETEWGWLLWSADTPSGTGVTLSVRASNDAGDMGSWSDVDWGADLGEVYPEMKGYLQYRVGLATSDTQVTPTVASIGVCPYFHLVSPGNGSVVDTLTPTLDWGDAVVPDLDTYTLWWGTDPTFGTYNEVTGIVDSTYRITEGVADGDVIYWRVKAEDSSSNAFWAPEKDWSFTVDLDFDVELAYLDVRSEEEGVLVGWSFEGEVPAGVRVLREVAGEITPLHADSLPGTATRYLDRGVEPDVAYRYWLEVTTTDGVTTRFGPTEAVSVADDTPELILYAAYPNPSRDTINFVFSLPSEGRVALSVYDLSGRRIATCVDSELTAGRHEVTWSCAEVPSGVYLYRLETGAGSLTQRLVVSR
jgi:hypothetical protein